MAPLCAISLESSLYTLHAHLLLKDYTAALKAWETLSDEEHETLQAQKMQLEILCGLGDLPAVLKVWKDYIKQTPSEDILEQRELLEEIAWMVITQTCHSSGLLTCALSILASGVGNDSRGVSLLVKALQSPHAILRKMAAEIAGQMRDDALKEAIIQRLSQERVWEVRQKLIGAVGKMGITGLSDWLLKRMDAPHVSEEERIACVEARILMHQRVDQEMLEKLVRASRSTFRSLACSLSVEYGDKACLMALEALLDDSHPQVQARALQALGLCVQLSDRERLAGRVTSLMASEDYEVRLTSAWFLAPVRPLLALDCVRSSLQDTRPAVRHFAIGVLSTMGARGLPLIEQCLFSQDVYIRVNAAIASLSLRHAQAASGTCLEQALTNQERWMWREEGMFRFVVPSQVGPQEENPDYPEAVNQLTRLELLHHLAVVGHPSAQRAMKNFLLNSVWSITGQLASLALMEGDKEVLEQVFLLQKDNNPRVRMQAALVLSLWGRDPRVIAVLEEGYQGADHMMKGMILEAIGRVGHPCSLPFLLRALQEPSEQLRLIGAMSILGCLQKS